jgi:hypothetical protein
VVTRPPSRADVFERIAGRMRRLDERPPLRRRAWNFALDAATLSARAWGRGVDQAPSAASVAR